MKRSVLVSVGVALACLTGSLQSLEASDTSPLRKDAVPWSQKMQRLHKALADLLTDLTSDKRFYAPANASRIALEADRLALLIHDLTRKGVTNPDVDPTIPIVAGLLKDETARAVRELQHGNRADARRILKSVPAYCIACHTRNASGPQFAELAIEPTSSSLTSAERGEFYAATRQFERAKQEFLKVIRAPTKEAAFSPAWERAVHEGLAIAVRVQQDPVQALEVVQAVLDARFAPLSVKEDAKAWKISIQEWQQELPRQAKSEEGLFAEALRLIARAKEVQKYPLDRTADILYLRTTSVVHDLLQVAPHGSHAGDALMLAGISYEVLSPLYSGDLHEVFYEACIRQAPHTSTAYLCYRRYEQGLFYSYAGNAEAGVPDEVRKLLGELRDLSRNTGE